MLLTFWVMECYPSLHSWCMDGCSGGQLNLIAWPQFNIAAHLQSPMGTIIFSPFWFVLYLLHYLFVYYWCVCVCLWYVWGDEHASAHIWRSDDKLVESVLCIYITWLLRIELGLPDLCNKCLYASYLTVSHRKVNLNCQHVTLASRCAFW